MEEQLQNEEVLSTSETEITPEVLRGVTYDFDNLNIAEEKLDILRKLGVNPGKPEDIDVTDDEGEKTRRETDRAEESINDVKIDTNVEEPNLILSRAELIRALRYASIMIKKVTTDREASSLNITYKDDGKVVYRLEDNMTWVTLDGTCKVSNNNPILKTLSFNVSYLASMLSAAAEDFLIYQTTAVDKRGDENEVFYARLINGDFLLDHWVGDESKLVPRGNKTTVLGTISFKTVSTLCDSMIPLISNTQEVSSMRSVLYEDRAFFKSSVYLLQFKEKFARMCLSKKELELLKLVSQSSGDILTICSTDSEGENRIVFTAPGIEISTSVSVPNRDEVILVRLQEMENAKYIHVNKDELKRVLFLAGLGMNNVGNVVLNYNADGQGLDAVIKGKNGDSPFSISGTNAGSIIPLDESVVVYAPQLAVLLRSFEGGTDLEVSLSKNGIILRDATLGIEASMIYITNVSYK